MLASIFTAPKYTKFKFQLVIHSQPELHGNSVQKIHFFNSKADAKRAAKELGAQAWNY